MSIAGRCWRYPERIEYKPELLDICGSKLIAQLLANRGIVDPDEAEAFLNISEDQLSSPFEFEDMPRVISRIELAIKQNEHIVIYGDFDADGITSTSILLKTLKELKANVSYYIPERITESHGLNSAALCRLISVRKAKLIITCDCGISNVKETALAKGLGVDIIITDHHELPEILPDACAIISTKLLDNNSKMTVMAGAGVAYKVAQALLDHFDRLDYLDELIYLCAIGTIADIVPQIAENRVITFLGLKKISELKPLALQQIAKNAALSLDAPLKAETVAFGIAPRLNALGRLDNASLAVDLLTTDNLETIEILAGKVEELNKKRQHLCDKIFREACEMLKDQDLNENKAIILASPDWHPGVIGIVASKLVETFYRPAFLINTAGSEVRGSARGIDGLHLFDVLNNHKDLFTKFGGHELAAGFIFPAENLNKFKIEVSREVNDKLSGQILVPLLYVEMDICADDLKLDLLSELDKLAPFGQNNPAPLFSCSDLILDSYKVIGSNSNHLRVTLRNSNNKQFEGVWWQRNTIKYPTGHPVRVAFSPESNTFMDRTKLQLVINDMMPAEADPATGIITKNAIKWVDHRNKTDITNFINSFIKLNRCKIAVFAESNGISQNMRINCPVINRFSPEEEFKQLVILEYPPEQEILSDIIRKTNPDIVHLAPFSTGKVFDEKELIKYVVGMLKYACNNKGSEADISLMAAKMGMSVKAVSCVIDLLVVAGVVNIKSCLNGILKFEMEQKNIEDISIYKEYNKLVEELIKVNQFRKDLLQKPATEFSSY